MSADDLFNRFSFHPAKTEAKQAAHEVVRASCLGVADVFDDLVPDGREKALAITKLEEAMFWANAAIARNGS